MDNYYNRYADPEYFIKKENQKNEIKSLGLYVGLAFICQIVLQYALSLIISFSGLTEKYLSDGVFQNSADTVIAVVSFFLPFCLIGKKMKEVSGVSEPLSLGKPCDTVSLILAVVAGVGFCMLANIVTSYFTVFLGSFGISLYSPDIAMPGGSLGVTMSIVRIVVIAAVTEELTLRGYVMGNLRKYGDKFAIIASSIVFAVIHGNLVQAPFALIAGFALGYLSVKTGTIWTGIAIHAANNFISVAISYAMEILPEETVNLIYACVLYGFIIFGLIALWLLKSRTAHISVTEDCSLSTTSEKMKAFFLNPAMIIALGYMLYITMKYIGFEFLTQ